MQSQAACKSLGVTNDAVSAVIIQRQRCAKLAKYPINSTQQDIHKLSNNLPSHARLHHAQCGRIQLVALVERRKALQFAVEHGLKRRICGHGRL